MTTTVATLQAVITADSTGFVRSMDSVRGSINGVEGQSNSLVQTMGKVGATMTAAVTLPLLGIAAASVKAASGFDASMHNINSIIHMSGAEMDALSAKTLAFGATTREGPQKVADALYQVYSAGITGSAAFDIMSISTKTAEAGLADLDATTRAMTATMQAYSNQNITTAEASNVWTKMVQVGVGSMDEFVSGAQRVLPSGAALGISFRDLGANLAFMSQMGGGATQAETAVSMAMTNLMKPTKAMSAAFQKLGVQDASALIKKFGSLEGAVIALKKASTNSVDFAKMFSKGGLQYVTAVTNNVDKAKQAVADFSTGLGDATQSAWDEQMKSFAAESDHFNSALQTLVITIGQQLLPILSPLIEEGTKFILNLTRTNPEIIKMAVAFGIAVAAVGPLLLIITALFNPITLLVGIVAAIGVAFSTNFMGIQTIVTNVLGTVGALIAPFITSMQALWEVVTGQGVDMSQAGALTTFVDDLQNIVDKVQGKATELNTTPIDIKIPIKAGMTLYDIYYNSTYSADLKKAMSYDDFVKQAKAQIKGGDPRWLRVGDTLSFSVGVGPTVDAQPIVLKTGIDWGFQIVKDDIQKQYDYVFKGAPLVNAGGEDITATLPILVTVKNVVDNVKLVVATWKDAFGVALTNIKNGVADFLKGFEGHDYTGLQKIVSTLITIFSDVATVVEIIASKVLIYASSIASSVLKGAGQVIADFLQVFSDIGNSASLPKVGNDINKFIVSLIEGIANIVAHILGGDGAQIGPGLQAFANGVEAALILIINAFQNGWRDLKVAIDTFVSGFFDKMHDVMKTLHDAHIITDEQFLSFDISANNVKIDLDNTGFAKAVETAITNGGKGIGSITIDGANLKTQIAMGDAKAIADNMTTVGKQNLVAAIKLALTNGDPNGILPVALPIAVAGNLDLGKTDFSKVTPAVRKELADALNNTTVGADGKVQLLGNTDMGKQIIDGVVAGMNANLSTATDAMTTTAESIKASAEASFGIHSPSKWAMGVAGFIVAGMIAGFVIGTVLLVIASNLMALMGVKVPLTAALSAAAGSSITNVFMGGLIAPISDANGSLQAAIDGVIGMFQVLSTTVLGIGNTLANQMQVIVDRLEGQLASLRSAIALAAGLQAPTGGPAKPTQVSTPKANHRASGGSVGITWVGERGPEPVVFGQKGSVVSSRAVRDMVQGTGGGNTQSQTNNVTINGVQDVDKMLFELKRRGIKLQT